MTTVKTREEFPQIVGKICIDQDPINPREWENIGTISYWHSHYKLGDEKVTDIEDFLVRRLEDIDPKGENESISSLISALKGEIYPEDIDNSYTHDHVMQEAFSKVRTKFIVVPVFCYEHSGIALRTTPFHCPWDSGCVGMAWTEKGSEGLSDEGLTNTLGIEIETYSQYLSGEVYTFIVEVEGDVVECCGGFYSEAEAEYEMECAMNFQAKKIEKENQEVKYWNNRDVVTL